MSRFETHRLSNGTRVVFVPHADTAAATLLVLFEVGSRYETKKINGASHFIEHMMFKGTERRPNTLAISRDLDSVGADYNAFTSKDYTGYYIRLQAGKLGLAVDMLEDMLYHSKYEPKEVESERNVILEEIHMYDDNPMMLVEELMEEEYYAGSSLGWRISGTEATMAGITRDRLVAYRDAYYAPSRTVVAVAGNFRPAEVLPQLEAKFGGRGEPAKKPKPFARFADSAKSRMSIRLQRKDTEQAQLAIGFPGLPYGHADLSALSLMSVILGGNMSSRLFTSVRERSGYAYFIKSSLSPFQDVGNLVIQSGLAKAHIRKALALIVKELQAISAKPVSQAELGRAKEYVRGKMSLDLEESSHLADWYARQELLTKKIETPEARLKKIFAVTAEDVRRAAKRTFSPDRAALAVIGPYDDEASFLKPLESL